MTRPARRRHLRYGDFERLRYSTHFLEWLEARSDALAGTGRGVTLAAEADASMLPVEAALNYTGVPAADDTVTLGTTVYTWKDTVAAAGDVLRDADAPALYHFQNLVDAINGARRVGESTARNTNLGLTLESGVGYTNVVLTARAAGTDGNSLTWSVGNGVTATDTDGNAVTSGTLSGGDDSTAASDTLRITALAAGGTLEAGGTTYTFRAPGFTLAANDVLLTVGSDVLTVLYDLRDASDGVTLGYHLSTTAHANVTVTHDVADGLIRVVAKPTATTAVALAAATDAALFENDAMTLAHGMSVGEGPWRVSVALGGLLPAPLDGEALYWVVDTPTPNHVALGHEDGGNAIELTRAGAFTLTRAADDAAIYELLRAYAAETIAVATDVDDL